LKDPRLQDLATNLVGYSIDCQPGDKVLIEMHGDERELVKSIVEAVYTKKGLPFVNLIDHSVLRTLLMHATEEQISVWAEQDLARMKSMNAYIGIRAGGNVNELSDVPGDKMRLYERLYRKPVHSEQRVKHTKWVVLRYPNDSMSQLANMSTEAFENFYFKVCNLDYAHMSEAMNALVTYMEKTDKVRIISPGTDLSFSIKGIPAIKCDGRLNIPDGEVFTAPIRESVQGTLTYNTPSVYNGITFENISFRFDKGQIVEAKSNDTGRLNEILDQDEGARYIGEFSLGFNPHILYPMKDILFDEKIAGSLHFTPGQAYEEADNGNRSAVHWDLVLIQREDYGGGEIWFDDVLIRKDGLFVAEELLGLNPDHFI
jgi:aminopeptidase